jgi:hypothetical protein
MAKRVAEADLLEEPPEKRLAELVYLDSRNLSMQQTFPMENIHPPNLWAPIDPISGENHDSNYIFDIPVEAPTGSEWAANFAFEDFQFIITEQEQYSSDLLLAESMIGEDYQLDNAQNQFVKFLATSVPEANSQHEKDDNEEVCYGMVSSYSRCLLC